MRVLLIAPPFYRLMGYYTRHFPMGLVSLGSSVKARGHEVAVYNADHSLTYQNIDYSRLPQDYPNYLAALKDDSHPVNEEIRQTLREHNPKVVGITVMTHFIAAAFKVAMLAKEVCPDAVVVMGGPHCTLKPEELFDCDAVDFVFRGEAEISFADFVDRLEKGEDPTGVPGLNYMRDGKMVANPSAGFVADLDDLPIPDRSLLLKHQEYSGEDMGLLMTGRGCPYACAFCATVIWERKTRYRSIDNVIAEIKAVMAAYGTTQFAIKDDSFVLDKKRIAAFCKRLHDEKLEITWSCNCNMKVLTRELLDQMRAAGCNSISLGIESGSERILKLMDKKITREIILRDSKMLNDSGVFWTAYFMMGVPTETREDVMESIELLKRLRPSYVAFAVYEIFPGTPFYDLGVATGVAKSRMSMEEYFNTLPHNYYFVGGERHSDTMTTAEFHDVEQIWRRECAAYNRSFARLFQRAKARRMIYVKRPIQIFEDAVKLIRWYLPSTSH